MNRSHCYLCSLLGLLVVSLLSEPVHSAPPQVIDDRTITVQSAGEIAAKRRALIQHLWGAPGFPKGRLPDSVVTNVPSPVSHLTNLLRVDEIRIELMPGLQGLAYHFVPQRSNKELVVVHQGHACTLNDDPSPAEVGYGLQRTIAGLLSNGFGVLGVFMPHMRPGDCTGDHERLFQSRVTGSPIKLFLEPVAVGLNYLERRHRSDGFPKYKAFHMVGLSGGGWTTTIYAAVDTRIRCSFPVAGTIPLYLRSGGSVGDREQYEPSFYSLASYLDLYILGAHGRDRKQIQILVRRDDCCFGEAQHKTQPDGLTYAEALSEYAQRVRAVLENTRCGSFELKIDDVAPSHMISHYAINKVILPELSRTSESANAK